VSRHEPSAAREAMVAHMKMAYGELQPRLFAAGLSRRSG
jgi:hypothetical protein